MNIFKSPKEKFLAPCVLALCTGAMLAGPLALAENQVQNQNVKPSLLRDVGIDQKLNAQLPLDLTFHNSTGNVVRLGEYFGDKPVILALVYYECPMLCTQELNGLLRSLQNITLDVGKQFNVVTVSFNPKETPGLAANKKKVYVGIYGRAGAAAGWHFLTGDETNIQKLTNAVGFHYAYNPVTDQYAHATAIMVATPKGRISRYFYGIDYPSRDLRLSLVEASNDKIGTPVDQILLYCYCYDPATGKYGLVIANVLRLAGSITILVLGGLIWVLFRHDKKPKTEAARAQGNALRHSG
jgi:protein SCO1